MVNHAVKRTSPYGEEFIGTCMSCGLKDLPASAAQQECNNLLNHTFKDQLLQALEDNK